MPSKQTPIHSGFGFKTTAREVMGNIDLSGKTALVTGGYSGLGLETSRILAGAGATVVVPVRNPDKARAALEDIPRVEMEAMDLLDPASIDALARRFVASGRPLHILVNSAGIMATPLQRDARGYESQFATNHLGHFQLASGLWPALKRADGARVVSVSSRGHRIAGVDLEDPNFEKRPYDKWQAYGQSKSANALFAMGLDLRAQAHGVRALSLHPGSIMTDLARYMTQDELRAAGAIDEHGQLRTDEASGMKTIEQGAATSVWCAVSPQLDGVGGVYCEDCDIAQAVPADHAQPYGVRPWVVDPELAERLWRLSEQLCGIDFQP